MQKHLKKPLTLRWMASVLILLCLYLPACRHADQSLDSTCDTEAVTENLTETTTNTTFVSTTTTKTTVEEHPSTTESASDYENNTTTSATTATDSTTVKPTETQTTAMTTTIATAAAKFLHLTVDEGWIIYQPSSWGYRYGPSIIIDDDGTINIWFASPGKTKVEWDWIRYRNSTDGGQTWSNEVVALKPTEGSEDAFSVCDPGVIKIGDYYYIGYTSTMNSAGLDNNIYLARSTSPTGPYEKWDGSGWGGDPKPIVAYDGTEGTFGAGEPSFVLMDNTIYMYYSWLDTVSYTRVATAPADDPNWPAQLTFQQQIEREDATEDSWDVKYIDDYHMFIATSIVNRMQEDSAVVVRQSTDGIHFTVVQYLQDNISEYSHNGGISARDNGHIRLSDANFYCYAYGSSGSWGSWSTLMNPITISLTDKADTSKTGTNRVY